MRARTLEQLANAIESPVTSYLDEVRHVAQEALERSLCPLRDAGRPSKATAQRALAPREAKRRNTAEIDAAAEQLCGLVRARSGDSIVTLAEELCPWCTSRRSR